MILFAFVVWLRGFYNLVRIYAVVQGFCYLVYLCIVALGVLWSGLLLCCRSVYL